MEIYLLTVRQVAGVKMSGTQPCLRDVIGSTAISKALAGDLPARRPMREVIGRTVYGARWPHSRRRSNTESNGSPVNDDECVFTECSCSRPHFPTRRVTLKAAGWQGAEKVLWICRFSN